jgi:hypothetical protein
MNFLHGIIFRYSCNDDLEEIVYDVLDDYVKKLINDVEFGTYRYVYFQ